METFLIILVIVVGVVAIFAQAEVLRKAGYNQWLALLMIMPGINLIVWFWFAFSQWPITKTKQGIIRGTTTVEEGQKQPTELGVTVQESDAVKQEKETPAVNQPKESKGRYVFKLSRIYKTVETDKTIGSDFDFNYLQETLSCPTCRFADQDAKKQGKPWCNAPNLPKIARNYCQTFERIS